MSTQVQGLSDNLEEIKSRLGKLTSSSSISKNSVQSVDAKISGTAPAPATGTASPTASTAGSSAMPAGAPSADTLYSNGLRDITSGKYDLARSEFQDYLKYTATPTSPPTRNSISAKFPSSKSSMAMPSPPTRKF